MSRRNSSPSGSSTLPASAPDRIAELAGLDVDALGYRLRPCKGDYFALRPGLRGLARHLIYPVPAQAGLGIHLTLDLAGGLRAGPDVEYMAAPRYDVDASKAAQFGAALRRYLPEVQDGDLSRTTPACAPSCRVRAKRRATS